MCLRAHPSGQGRRGCSVTEHDDLLWNQRSFLVSGALEQGSGGWILRPQQFIPGIGVEGMKGFIKFLITARRDTRRYLAERGIPRPDIPWQQLNELKHKVKRVRSQQGTSQ